MYNINMFKNKKIDKARYISIAFIILLTVPGILVTALAGSVGSYIGSVLFMAIGIFAIWETLTSLGFNKYVSLITALSIIPFFLLKYSSFTGIAELDPLKNNVAVKDALTWQPYLILVAASFIPVLAEPKVASEKIGMFTMQAIVTFVMLVAATFTKGLWALNSVHLASIFYFILIAIIADSFGYFGGKYFGKYLFKGAKLAPRLSPKKTWAGAVIGFVFSFTFAFLFGYYLHIWENVPNISELAMSFIMATVLSLISPIGDLMFSGIKRLLGIKDFSNLLPGHGGVFDRIDAMSIVTALGLLVFIIFA